MRERIIQIVVVLLVMFMSAMFAERILHSNKPEISTYELDNHRECLLFYPEDAVWHLQKSLNFEGYQCEIDGVLGIETLNAYNTWRQDNE